MTVSRSPTLPWRSRTCAMPAPIAKRGITARIARECIENEDRLNRYRWMVERTHAWFAGSGKLRIRFECRLDVSAALLSLAMAIICSRFVVKR